MPEEILPEEQKQNEENIPEISAPEFIPPNTIETTPVHAKPQNKKRKFTKVSEPDAVDQLLIKHLTAETTEDKNYHFLKELGIQLNSLPDKVQLETKFEITQLVYGKLLSGNK